jgi:hypothetical protein
VSRQTLGFLVTVVGSALGAWWLASQRQAGVSRRLPSRDHGVVIFDNTPTAVDGEVI